MTKNNNTFGGNILQNKFLALSIGLGIAVFLLLSAIGYLVMPKNRVEGINSTYQGVFLTNGQVYFGKIDKAYNSEMSIKLTDVYYLQAQTKGQSVDLTNTNFNLLKLGNELHGPKDEMFISSSQILFWENLRDDGKVIKAIKEFKK